MLDQLKIMKWLPFPPEKDVLIRDRQKQFFGSGSGFFLGNSYFQFRRKMVQLQPSDLEMGHFRKFWGEAVVPLP